MMTLLQSALTGWTDYTQHGKFAALLLLAILYLGLVLHGTRRGDCGCPEVRFRTRYHASAPG